MNSDEALRDVDRVQVQMYLDFSDESEKAIQVAWKVANDLLERNIWVEVEPIHTWLVDPIEGAIDLPKVFINGKLMFIGRAPTYAELVDAILDRVGKRVDRKLEGELVVSADYDNGFCEVAVEE